MIATNIKLKKRSWQGAAEVLEIVDGDTLKCDVDLGFKVRMTTNVRVHGCNCPELPTPAGVRALAFTQTLVRPGEVVQLDSKRLDKFGRPVCQITLADGRDLATLLLTSGNAIPADSSGNLDPTKKGAGEQPGPLFPNTPQNTAWK
jgi:endonuclease YncB( thermonuclease family)